MATKRSVFIEFKVLNDQYRKGLKKVISSTLSARKEIKKFAETGEDTGKRMIGLRDANSRLTKSMSKGQIMEMANSYDKFSGALKGVDIKTRAGQFKTGMVAMEQGMVKTTSQIHKMKSPLMALGATVQQQKMGFQMWALGVMFFGMQMLRVFSRIAKSAFDTFNKVMGESINTAREAMMGLSASTEMLKFSIGSAIATALEPMMPTILAIIDAISEWVELYPKLTTAIVLGGVALGGFMFFLGQMVLFISSLAILWYMWGKVIFNVIKGFGLLKTSFGFLIKTFPWFGKILGFFKFLGGKIFSFLVPVWAVISGTIDIFKNWGKSTKDVVKGIIKVLLGILGAVALVLGAPAWVVAAIVAACVFIVTVIVKYWDEIAAFFVKWGSLAYNWGKDLILNFWEGIKSVASWFKDQISKAFGWIADIFSFDDAANDLMAQKWGSDMVKNFSIGASGGGGTGGGSASAAPSSVVININGNVMGDDKFIKQLGDVVAANMRRQGNNATVYG